MIEFLRRASSLGKFDSSLNSSLIALILKVDNPCSITRMRLIASCNVIVKIVTKFIANKLKLLMPKQTSPSLCSLSQGAKLRIMLF